MAEPTNYKCQVFTSKITHKIVTKLWKLQIDEIALIKSYICVLNTFMS